MRAIIASWIGTSTAAELNGIGTAAAVAAPATDPAMCRFACRAFASRSTLCAAARAAWTASGTTRKVAFTSSIKP